ncbi:hypothetical protein Bhyg_09621 [Pseudolycoriella hygida]|uniref:PPAF-2-like Clip domain-containing protein n=1 Tax=Pseudolycoriella hygida TaxID=35572 RepID=A0A9Q0S448_9DIPT|nr:hypothetical protein Bhyg_09621 [Pseudolycoriella hygida]
MIIQYLGRQASPLPSFPTLSVPVPTTVSVTPVASPLAIPVGGISTNIVTPAGQTCVCVPTGACTPGTTGTPGGEGLIDIRIVNNLTVHTAFLSTLALTFAELSSLSGANVKLCALSLNRPSWKTTSGRCFVNSSTLLAGLSSDSLKQHCTLMKQ